MNTMIVIVALSITVLLWGVSAFFRKRTEHQLPLFIIDLVLSAALMASVALGAYGYYRDETRIVAEQTVEAETETEKAPVQEPAAGPAQDSLGKKKSPAPVGK